MCLSFTPPQQKIEGTKDSTVNQAGGDLTINQGIQYPELRQVVTDIVKSEMFQLSQKAEETKMERAMEYERRLTEQLASNTNSTLIPQFQRPDIQFAMRDSLKEFIKKGSAESLEEQVEMLIERLTVDENSVMRSVIEEAIVTLSRLSKPAVALLASMRLRDLVLNCDTSGLIENFRSRRSMYGLLEHVTQLDIAYLRQLNCCQILTGLKQYISYENMLISKYDMLFRHYGSEDEMRRMLSEYDLAELRLKGQQLFIPYKQYGIICNCPRLSLVEGPLKQQGNEELFERLRNVVNSRTKWTADEVRTFILNEVPEFRFAFDVLNQEDVQDLKITPLGAYIGQKFLKRTINMNCPEICN